MRYVLVILFLLALCSSCMVEVNKIDTPVEDESSSDTSRTESSTTSDESSSTSTADSVEVDSSYPKVKNLILDESMTSISDVYINPALVATDLTDGETVEIYDYFTCPEGHLVGSATVEDTMAVVPVMLSSSSSQLYELYARRVDPDSGLASSCGTTAAHVRYTYTPPLPLTGTSLIDDDDFYKKYAKSGINRVVTNSDDEYVPWLSVSVQQHKTKRTHFILKDRILDPEPSAERNYICLLPTNTTDGVTKVLSSFKIENLACMQRTNLYNGMGYIFHNLSLADIGKLNGVIVIVGDALGKIAACTENVYRTTFDRETWNQSILTCNKSGGSFVSDSLDEVLEAFQATISLIFLDWAININAKNGDVYQHLQFQ